MGRRRGRSRADEDTPIDLDGHTFFRDARGEDIAQTANRVKLTVDDEETRLGIGDMTLDNATSISSRSPHVRRFVREAVAASRATSGEALRAVPKSAQLRQSPKPRVDPSTPVPCPGCNGEGWPGCILCDGEGWVSRRQARGFLGQDT